MQLRGRLQQYTKKVSPPLFSTSYILSSSIGVRKVTILGYLGEWMEVGD